VITHAVDDRAVVALLRAGASGCCFYDTDPATLKKAIDFVAKGQMWVSRTVIAFLLDQLTAAADAPEGGALSVATDPRFAELTPRQREIAALVGTAASNREIATRLHVTEKTVKAHLTAVFRTLGVTDRLQLALLVSRRA
jgi:DNA-binding NarL/FixJ family response regulator